MRYLPVVALLALTIYALVDCVRYEEDMLPAGMPRALWIVLIIVFPAAGPIAWLVVSRASRSAGSARAPARGTRPPGPGARPPRRPTGPVAPDDDPQFLANLDRMRRAREREAKAAGGEQRPGEGPTRETTDEQESDKGDGAAPAGTS